MAQNTEIEWADGTWNPVTGCTEISPGCRNCYAKSMSKRLKAMGQFNYRNGFKVTLQPHMLDRPFEWQKPKKIFVNSMSDLFHYDVPDGYIKQVFDVASEADHHKYKFLTKRSERLLQMASYLPWPDNIWAGVSVENDDYAFRIDDLKQVPATVNFVSFEPLIGPILNLDLTGIDWVIVGGESGPNARPMKEAWVLDIRDQCLGSNTPFFFKQWGGKNKKKEGRLLEGKIWAQFPQAE